MVIDIWIPVRSIHRYANINRIFIVTIFRSCTAIDVLNVKVYLEIISKTETSQFKRTIDYTRGFNKYNSLDIGKCIQEAIDKYFDFQTFLRTSSLTSTITLSKRTALLTKIPSATTESDRFITSQTIINTKIDTINITSLSAWHFFHEIYTKSNE